jgi:hypothetical protein
MITAPVDKVVDVMVLLHHILAIYASYPMIKKQAL